MVDTAKAEKNRMPKGLGAQATAKQNSRRSDDKLKLLDCNCNKLIFHHSITVVLAKLYLLTIELSL